MTRSPAQLLVTPGLVVVCCALGWLVYEEATTPFAAASGPDRVTIGTRPADSHVVPPKPFKVPPIERFDEIAERPLFNPSRRPIPTQVPGDGNAGPGPSIMLSGIVIDADQRIAHLRTAGESRVHTLSPGDTFASWHVEAIEPDRVILRAGSRTETVFMEKSSAVHASPQRVAPEQQENVRDRRSLLRRQLESRKPFRRGPRHRPRRGSGYR